MNTQHAIELKHGERFAFGENWKSFLSTLNESRIKEAKQSLRTMLELEDLSGKSFLDIGCGSGLLSLVARQLGAEVHSFDYDPQSVACAQELKRRFFPHDDLWQIEEGSALDKEYLQSIGQFDIVYSWGVLHHTGDMMTALGNIKKMVKEGGVLYIAIYNDQELISKIWKQVKKAYCSNLLGKCIITGIFVPFFTLQSIAIGIVKYKNPLGQFLRYKNNRGMSVYHDWIDWLGGYPFEVAKPEKIFRFYRDAGFQLKNIKISNRLGCNEYIFRRTEGITNNDSSMLP